MVGLVDPDLEREILRSYYPTSVKKKNEKQLTSFHFLIYTFLYIRTTNFDVETETKVDVLIFLLF